MKSKLNVILTLFLLSLLAVGAPLVGCGPSGEGGENAVDRPDDDGDDDNGDDDNGDDDNGDDDNGDDDNGDNGDVRVCLETCNNDADCGHEAILSCVDGFCEIDQCETDADCEPFSRGWFEVCEQTAECNDGMVCIDVDGQGFCATEEPDDFSCADMSQEPYGEVTFEDGETVTVCGMDEDYECSDNLCIDPEMVDDGDDGEDQCQDDADCDDVDNADTCYDGVCGCSDDEVCAEDFTCTTV